MDITILGIESSCDDTSAAVLRNNVLPMALRVRGEMRF